MGKFLAGILLGWFGLMVGIIGGSMWWKGLAYWQATLWTAGAALLTGIALILVACKTDNRSKNTSGLMW